MDSLREEVVALEAKLRGLLGGQHTSLTIGFNDDHACNYIEPDKLEEFYSINCRIDWVSEAERKKAMATNSVWTLQWYPNTPVGFHCIGASSLPALVESLSKDTDQ